MPVRCLLRLATLCAALGACSAMAQSGAAVFKAASPSVVVVRTLDATGNPKGQGSGVAIGHQKVVTKCHVLEGGVRLIVRHGGREHAATRQHSDPERDVCSLSVPGLAAKPAALGSTRELQVGQKVYAIGAPQGLELTLSEGIVSGLREVRKGDRILQVTTPISPGSSGGGLFDEQGRLIGLTSFYLSEGQQLNFAVPVEWASALPQRAADASTSAMDRNAGAIRVLVISEKGDWSTLRDHALSWTRAESSNAIAWFVLGAAYGGLMQHAKAIEAYEQALRIDPKDAAAWYNLGVAYSALRQHRKAVGAFEEALRINANNAFAWYNLGNAYAHLAQNSKSIDAYEKALRIAPAKVSAWYNLGVIYRTQGQRSKVRKIYERLRVLDREKAEEFFTKVVLP